MNWLCVYLLAFLLVQGDVLSLSLDPAASDELEHIMSIKKGDCVISMRHIRPRRKLHISIEALFMIDFPTLKHQMSFFLDRKAQRVTLDMSDNGATESKHFQIGNVNETSTIRSLALHFRKNCITLLVDCGKVAAHEIDMNLAILFSQMDNPVIKLFRERKYPLHFDGNLENALQRANCQKEHRGNRRMLKNKISEREKNKKRDVRNWLSLEPGLAGSNDQYRQQQEIPVDIERRGDIPVMHGDCEDALAKSLSDLMALVKLLREDVANQRQEIAYLRNMLENCAGCKEPTNNNIVRLDSTCRSANSCYPGVECHETVQCGICPDGMVGDGKVCKPGVTCADRPCFVGVQCHDTVTGAQCESCPAGSEGDGFKCTIPSGNIIMPTHNVQHFQRQYSRKYSVMTS